MTQLQTMALHIANLGACQEAQDWLEHLDPSWTPQQAWDACSCADWMLWLIGRSKNQDKVGMVKIACAIARKALKHIPEGELRPLRTIEAAEAWTKNPNEETAREVENTYAGLNAVEANSANVNVAYAARTVAYVARAISCDTKYTAAYSAVFTARTVANCDIIRKQFPNPPKL